MYNNSTFLLITQGNFKMKRRLELTNDEQTPAAKKTKAESAVSIVREGLALLPIEVMQLILSYCNDQSMYRILLVFSLNMSLLEMNFSENKFFNTRLSFYGIDYAVKIPNFTVPGVLYHRDLQEFNGLLVIF